MPAEGLAKDRATFEEFKQRVRVFAGTDFGAHSFAEVVLQREAPILEKAAE